MHGKEVDGDGVTFITAAITTAESPHGVFTGKKAGCDLFGPAEVKHTRLGNFKDVICTHPATD